MTAAYEQAAKLLAGRHAKIVVLGANASVVEEILVPDCEIWAVEPQPECVAKLQAQAAQDPRIHVVPYAVGERDSETPFNVNVQFDVTSSIRQPTVRGYAIGIPRSTPAVVNVPLAQVDTLVAKGLLPPEADLVVLDVQGHEREVLQGGRKFFSACWLALVEVTFKELYEGQALEPEVSELLGVCDLILDRPPFDETDWNKQDWTDAVYRRGVLLNRSYSQAKQDEWVRSLFPDLNDGTFIDIGCNHPTKLSNTYALELLGWRGLLVDVEAEYVAQCRVERKSCVVQCDGRMLNWLPQAIAAGIVAISQQDKPITYLSLDCDEVTPPVLTRILGSGLRFKCMTVEHDKYRFGDGPRDAMREQLLRVGYKLAVADVANGPGYEFEDWFVIG